MPVDCLLKIIFGRVVSNENRRKRPDLADVRNCVISAYGEEGLAIFFSRGAGEAGNRAGDISGGYMGYHAFPRWRWVIGRKGWLSKSSGVSDARGLNGVFKAPYSVWSGSN